MADTPDPDVESVITSQMLEQPAGPALPAGVIEVQDSKGNWWRYPLREYMEDSDD